jgi:L-ascorbate metabolism protein UlaG (beta-lactamase superfamily)
MRREMGAQYILPMHHSTFRLSRESTQEPINRLLAVAGDEQWRVALTEVGQTWTLPETDEQDAHARDSQVLVSSE